MMLRGGTGGELFSPFPRKVFGKDQVVLWPLVGFKFEINDDQACFMDDNILWMKFFSLRPQPFSKLLFFP